MKSLNISGTDVSKVDPKLLARAVVKLREITLTYTSLTMEQITEIMSALLSIDSKPTLTKLNIGGNDLSAVDPDMLSMGLTRVSRVSLIDTSLTNQQAISLLTRANNKSSSNLMTRLNLSENNLSQVPPQLLAGEIIVKELPCLLLFQKR